MNLLKKLIKASNKRMSIKNLLIDLENDFLYDMQNIPVHENNTRTEIKYFEDSKLKEYLRAGRKLYKQDSFVLIFAAKKALNQVVLDISLKKPMILEILGNDVESRKEIFQDWIKDYEDILAEYKPPLPKSKLLLAD